VEITEGEIRGLPLLAFEGDLDHSSKQAVREAVEDILRGAYPPKSLLLDLTDCPYLDSAGLGVLLSALRELPTDGWLGLIGVSPSIKRMLTYAGLLDIERVRFFVSPRTAAPPGPRPGAARIQASRGRMGAMGARTAALTGASPAAATPFREPTRVPALRPHRCCCTLAPPNSRESRCSRKVQSA
jgi:anti-anti-sigma factor